MENGTIAAVGTLAVAGLGYLVVQVIGESVVEAGKESAFRRPSLAVRRNRHRLLMKSGLVCTLLACMAGLFWLAAATSGRPSDASDARTFAAIGLVLALAGVALLAGWWIRAGKPQRS